MKIARSIESTVWLENAAVRMTSDFSRPQCALGATAEDRENELLRACVALMRELEDSLEGSRKALLALDLGGIERGTSDQVSLVRRLDSLFRHCGTTSEVESSEQSGARRYLSELEEELRQSQNRIGDALRLQSALLVRSRAKLRMLANMLAGPTVPYSALLARDLESSNKLTWK